MEDPEQIRGTDEPTESGALDGEGGDSSGGTSSDDPVESGALEDADELDQQQGKGYGADEGERDEALNDE